MVLKHFGKRVEENDIYDLVKPNSIVKTSVKEVTYVTKFFWL